MQSSGSLPFFVVVTSEAVTVFRAGAELFSTHYAWLPITISDNIEVRLGGALVFRDRQEPPSPITVTMVGASRCRLSLANNKFSVIAREARGSLQALDGGDVECVADRAGVVHRLKGEEEETDVLFLP